MLLAPQFVLSLGCGLLAHPTSISSSRIVVEGAHVALELRCQASSLAEALPIDRNGDGKLDANELASAHDELERYVLDGYRLTTGGRGTPSTEKRLDGRLISVSPTARDAGGLFPPEPLIDLAFAFDVPAPLADLSIEFVLFRESNPWHRDHAEMVWNGAPSQVRVLWIEDPTWAFAPEQAPARNVVAQ